MYIYAINYHDYGEPRTFLQTIVKHIEKQNINKVMKEVCKEADDNDIEFNDYNNLHVLLIKRGFEIVDYDEVTYGPSYGTDEYEVWDD
jgi:hypothetical protein